MGKTAEPSGAVPHDWSLALGSPALCLRFRVHAAEPAGLVRIVRATRPCGASHPPTRPEKGPGCFLQAVITNGPHSRQGLCRILCAPEDSCVSADTSLSPSPPAVSQSLCNHSGPRPAASPGPGNHSPPLPRLPPPAQSGACSHSPGGPPACLTVLSPPLILLSLLLLLALGGTWKCGSPAGLSLPRRT